MLRTHGVKRGHQQAPKWGNTMGMQKPTLFGAQNDLRNPTQSRDFGKDKGSKNRCQSGVIGKHRRKSVATRAVETGEIALHEGGRRRGPMRLVFEGSRRGFGGRFDLRFSEVLEGHRSGGSVSTFLRFWVDHERRFNGRFC